MFGERVKIMGDKIIRGEASTFGENSSSAILGGAFLISASLIYGLDGFTPLMVGGAPLISWILGALAVFFLVYAWTDEN